MRDSHNSKRSSSSSGRGPKRSGGSTGSGADPAPRKRTDSATSSGRGPSSGSTTRGRGPSSGSTTRGRGAPARTSSRRAPAPSAARGPKPKKKSGLWRAFFKVTLVVVLLGAVAAGITGCMVYNSVADSLPDPTKPLKGLDQTSKLLDRNGKVIADLFAEQNRTPIAIDKIPKEVREAVIATEDERFYQHEGVDFLGMLRALVTDIMAGEKVQGGSTITQQYVKTAFMTPERTIKRKVSEALLAYRVEQNYSKDQILQMYLNTIYFGHGAYGIVTAARAYFGKNVSELTLPEAAMLAGVIKSPGRFSPYMDEQAAKQRRDTVLAQMRNQGYIDEAAYAEAVATPVTVAGLRKGSAIAPYFVEYVKEQLVERYGQDKVYRSGLRVRTTLDLDMQRAAEAAVKSNLDRKNDPSAAVVAIDPKTGQILAMVGGRDFSTQQYNVAAQGHRQPGSSFKPFVLVTGLNKGVSPEATFTAGSITIRMPNGTPWKVAGHGGGVVRLRTGLEKSINPVFAQLVMKLGADEVVQTAREMGITTKITPVPAVALGGQKEGVSPLEMASAYGTLADGGKHMRPYSLIEVLDPTGATLLENKPKGTKVLDRNVAYLATDIMKGVIARGTGTAANLGRPAAGKTGTTQQNSDAWFVGYTPDLVAAVWVGYPSSMKPMTNVHGMSVMGGSFPAKIWAAFMRKALAKTPSHEFEKPNGLKTLKICLDSGQRATAFCPRTGRGLFLSDSLPEECQLHVVPTEVVMPSLKGITKVKALALLDKLKLKYKVIEKADGSATPGTVLGQDPPAGTKLKPGATVSVEVAGTPALSKPPVAAFEYTPKSPNVGTNVRFDAGASTDDTGIESYVWEFGDGAKDTKSGKVAKHSYAAPGTYEVTLWVTDVDGQAVTVTKTIVVK
jgi:penicillin-binding protein 1A